MEIYKQYMYSYPHKRDYYNIDSEVIRDSLKNVNNADFYIHIPFCSSRCGYCNLFSAVGINHWIDSYVSAIERQYKFLNTISKIDIESLIIGGGTPIIMSINQMERLFNIIDIDIKNCHSVIELSPNETTKEKISYIHNRGFKRVSIGIQSFDEIELKNLNRLHNVKNCLNALKIISEKDFENFNIDIIYGIENQTIKSLKNNIDIALSFNPTEIFIYPLYVRENTYIFNKYKVDEQKTYEFYRFISDYIINKGYFQTSMRRFVKRSLLDHNKNITCGFDTNISLGCGGRNYVNNVHFCEKYSTNQVNIQNTIKSFINKSDFIRNMEGYILSNRDMKNRFVVKNLLYYKGILIEDYKKMFNTNIFEDYITFRNNVFKKNIIYKDDRIYLKDLYCSDFIINNIFDYEEKFNELRYKKR